MSIFLTSDLHIGHDKEFIWKARGFKSIEEMNEAIVRRWNEVVTQEDTVYVLGDVVMGNSEESIQYLDKLNGYIIIIRGNHDSSHRKALYKEHGYDVVNAMYLNYHKYRFFLCHFPTDTSNDDSDKFLKARLLSLCGHTHNIQKWEPNGSYNVGLDAHNCYPISIDEIIEDFKEKYNAN